MATDPILSKDFQAGKTVDILDKRGSASFHLDLTNVPEVAACLAADQPFPTDGEIPMGSLKITVKADAPPIKFLQGNGSVSFGFSTAAHASIGRFFVPANVVKALGTTDPVAKDTFPVLDVNGANKPTEQYLVLSWGYEVSGAASGRVALAQFPAITFGLGGAATRAFAVVCRLPLDTRAPAAIAELGTRWFLPAQMGDPLFPGLKVTEALAPGTWIVADVEGKIAGKLGATYGYEFSWIRKLSVAGLDQGKGLAGDIGLKIELAASATVGYELEGRFTLVLSRPSARTDSNLVRLRLFKQKKNQWDFAFNAAAGITPSQTVLPENFDDLVSAMLGIHAQQVLKDLQALEDWADSKDPLPAALVKAGQPYLLALIKTLTGIDPAQEFQRAQTFLSNFLERWFALDQSAAAMLWNVAQTVDIDQIKAVCQLLANQDKKAYVAFLEQKLPQPEFLTTPAGQFLETLGLGLIVETIPDSGYARAKDVATKALSILNAIVPEGPDKGVPVLEKLKQYIKDKISLDALSKTALPQIDLWLAARLQSLLDKAGLTPQDIDKVRAFVKALKARQDWYEKFREALGRKYSFSLAAMYQSTKSDEALLDATFDLNHADAGGLLLAALGGDLRDLIFASHPGVKLSRAKLTHGVSRHIHVDVRLPFYNSSFDELNDAVAELESVVVEGDRVALYNLRSKDEVVRAVNGRYATDSHFALTACLPVDSGVRVHAPADTLTATYSFRQATTSTSRLQLQAQLGAYAELFFGQDAGSFQRWLTDVDIATHSGGIFGANNYGETLLALERSIPASLANAWLKASQQPADPLYATLSLTLQGQLKFLLPFFYFADVRHFDDLTSAYALLGYASLPPSLGEHGDVYWDYRVPGLVTTMLEKGRGRLAAAVQQAYARLGKSGTAGYYRGEKAVGEIVGSCDRGLASPWFQALVTAEAMIVHQTVDTAVKIAAFVQDRKSPKALENLTKFGLALTKLFNGKYMTLYGGEAVRPLGTALFVAACEALANNPVTPQGSSVMSLVVCKPGKTFPTEDFVAGKEPQATGPDSPALLRQTLAAVGGN